MLAHRKADFPTETSPLSVCFAAIFLARSYPMDLPNKLLLLPASKSGLFACAGQFVRIANQLGWPMNHLTAVLNERDGNPIKYWRIGTKLGEGSDAQDVWPDMKAGGYAAIGWAELGDLSSLLDEEDDEHLTQALAAMKAEDRSQQTRRIMHKDLHRH